MSRSFKELGTHERSAGWSLTAIMAIYHATLDPVYLEAAKRIVAVPLREQKFDRGGAWPHVLPGGHARGHRGAVGNNIFLIAVLLNGMHEYYAQIGIPPHYNKPFTGLSEDETQAIIERFQTFRHFVFPASDLVRAYFRGLIQCHMRNEHRDRPLAAALLHVLLLP